MRTVSRLRFSYRNPLVFLVGLVLAEGCRSLAVPPSDSSDAISRANERDEAALLPDPKRLFALVPALTIRTATTVELRRGGGTVTLRDEKEIRRLDNGDFDLFVRRVHQGSEAGDSEESFRAIRVGTEYFTRGSGGPFVQWDDALDEPDHTLGIMADEPRTILAFLAPCLEQQSSPNEVSWGLARPGCSLTSAPDAAQMTATVREASVRLRLQDGRPTDMLLTARMDVASGRHQAAVMLRHEAVWTPQPNSARIEPPKDPISSRRHRPLRMVTAILSGLVHEWGPGMPVSSKTALSAGGGSMPTESDDHSPTVPETEE